MGKFKRSKLLMLSTMLILVGCDNSSNDMSSVLNSDQLSSISENTTTNTSMVESEHVSASEPLSSEATSVSSETSVVSSSETPSSSEISSSEVSSSEVSIPESSLEPEIERDPGIYLERERIGVANSRTITIGHEVYPSALGEVFWEFVYEETPSFHPDNYPATVTPNGEVTGNYYTSTELLIKGTLFEYEVYVTLTVFLDYFEHTDTFEPAYNLSSVIGNGDRFHNGTTKTAGLTPLRNPQYYAYNLKAGMKFNVILQSRYSNQRHYHNFRLGKAVNKIFIELEMPFVSSDGEALLLEYDVPVDGEYIITVFSNVELVRYDHISFIMYTFWF